MNRPSQEVHMPQLDGLRTLAVTAVAISHWVPDFLHPSLPWGTGVQLFFVLSGFLITGILLRTRPSETDTPMSMALQTFYIRRALRIFPLYYGVLAVCLLMNVGPVRTTWFWHVSYLSNIYFAITPSSNPIAEPYLHFWSLSVEEQFYLFWPIVVFTTSRRTLLIVLYSFIIGSMAVRSGIAYFAPGLHSIRYLTPCCLDAFAIGGLIAFVRHYKSGIEVRRLAKSLAAIGGVGLVLFYIVFRPMLGGEEARRIGHTFLVILYGGAVAQASEGFGGIVRHVLTFKPVLYFGKISYGLYVFHYFAPVAITAIVARTGWEPLLRPPLQLFAYGVFTIALAIVSWHCYEFPINQLKRYFAYARGYRAPVEVARVAS